MYGIEGSKASEVVYNQVLSFLIIAGRLPIEFCVRNFFLFPVPPLSFVFVIYFSMALRFPPLENYRVVGNIGLLLK